MITALCSLVITSLAWAGSGDALFKQKCGSCHVRGGEAAPVNPGDKAGRVWKKYFLRGRHPVELSVTDADMDEILSYLEEHAADSDKPAMAVIPK
ncbi:MAG: cytochrome c [Proteobacteria bacterium]|nr:cytochrome c [Pseudomonadota bacterium]MBU1736577.1 cytochrome c [Pseudomonadota bacterium]